MRIRTQEMGSGLAFFFVRGKRQDLTPILLRIATLLAVFLLALAAGCMHQPPAAEEMGRLTGTIAYKEGMALPPDAEIEVRLADVAKQDVAAYPIAETRFTSQGRQVPLPFELVYARKAIEPDRSYAVRATIRSGGRLLFTTDRRYAVITAGNPTHVDMLLVRVGERPGAAGDGGSLWGTAWRLEDLSGTAALDKVEATLEFLESGKVAGRGSCNRFFGSAKITGDAIAFGALGATQMACMEAVARQEARYLGGLRAAERYALDGSTLRIYVKGDAQPLRFTRVK